ncbi:MAG: prolipoprotein diacylglyceryl transferase [Patescibacteria group bacterium]
MIPWIQWTTIYLGALPIQIWGLLVALGFLFGAVAAAWMARRRGLDPKHIYDLAAWIVVAAMIGGRLFHVVFYDPDFYLANPGQILAFWQGGMSIYGGFVGAILASLVYCQRRKLSIHQYADAVIFGLPLGMFIGRIGCFLIHDHPGTATSFFLGVKYPDGVIRHDLGLYESLNGLILFFLFLLLAKRHVKQGTYIIVFCLWYGVSRFLLDFLRLVDVRYLGLTPGQYLSAILIGLGIILWLKPRSTILITPVLS